MDDLLHLYEIFWDTKQRNGYVRITVDGKLVISKIAAIRALPKVDDKLIILEDKTSFKLSQISANKTLLVDVKLNAQ